MRILTWIFLTLFTSGYCFCVLRASDNQVLAGDTVYKPGIAGVIENGVTAPESPAFSAPTVVYEHGKLYIWAENCSLRDILEDVRRQTGATIEAASLAMGIRIFAYIYSGNPARVMADLLYNSGFNYIIVGSEGSTSDIKRIILIQRNAAREHIADAKLAQALPPRNAPELPNFLAAVSNTHTTNQDSHAPSQALVNEGAGAKQKAGGEQESVDQQVVSSAKTTGQDPASGGGQDSPSVQTDNSTKSPAANPGNGPAGQGAAGSDGQDSPSVQADNSAKSPAADPGNGPAGQGAAGSDGQDSPSVQADNSAKSPAADPGTKPASQRTAATNGGQDSPSVQADNSTKSPAVNPGASNSPDDVSAQGTSVNPSPTMDPALAATFMKNLFPSLFSQSQSTAGTSSTSIIASNSGGTNSTTLTSTSSTSVSPNFNTNPSPATYVPTGQIQIGSDGNPIIPGIPPEVVSQLCQSYGMTCTQLINTIKNNPTISTTTTPPTPAVVCPGATFDPRLGILKCGS
jgi:hypothetical protein